MKKIFQTIMSVFLLLSLVQIAHAVGNDAHTRLLIHSNTTDKTTYVPNGVDDNTILLIHSETPGGNTFTDSSFYAHPINPNPTCGISHNGANYKISSSSIYFDGVDDYLELTGSPNFDFGAGEFTIDFWIFGPDEDYGLIFVNGNSTAQESAYKIYTDHGSINLQVYIDNTVTSVVSPPVNDGRWHHIAFVRDNSGDTDFIKVFVDGNFKTETRISGSHNPCIPNPRIGMPNTSSMHKFIGYLDEFRISNTARFRENFTPQTDKYTPDLIAVVGGDDEFKDSTNRHEIKSFYGAAHSIAEAKFGSSSMYFDGVNDHLKLTAPSNIDFGAGEFTIDFWVLGPYEEYGLILANGNLKTAHESAYNIYTHNGAINLQMYIDNTVTSIVSPPVNNGRWHHIAFVRDNSGDTDYIKVYVDGDFKTQTSISGSHNPSIPNPRIGMHNTSDRYKFKGYLDEFRISDIARWREQSFPLPTAPYTPPDVQLQFEPQGTYDTTIYLTVEQGKTVTIDWGNPSVPPTTVIGTGSRERHNELASGISINGDLDGILTFKADRQIFITGNLSTFEGLTNLRRLEMNFTGIEGDISSLSNLTDLEYIGLSNSSGNRTTFSKKGKLSSLSNLQNLKYLAINNTEVSGDISNLSGLTNLEELWLYSSDIEGDIGSFSGLVALKYLWIYNTIIGGSISGIEYLTNLQHLIMHSTSVYDDIDYLKNLVNLRYLWMHYTGVAGDIAKLNGLTQLEYFRARVTNVTYNDKNADLSGWANCDAFDFYSCRWDSDMVDDLLIKLNDDLDSTEVSLKLNGNNEPRTSNSDDAIACFTDSQVPTAPINPKCLRWKNWAIEVNE